MDCIVIFVMIPFLTWAFLRLFTDIGSHRDE